MSLIDRIKFDSPSDEVLVWKYPKEDLTLGSQLIVNQSQEAVFLKGGEVGDVFGPGTHTLTTGNLPILNKIINLPFGQETPFTAEIWFVNKTVKRDLKWGTQSPIPLIEPQYNFPISVRAHGRWGIRVKESGLLVLQIVGAMGGADSARIHSYFIGEIQQRFSVALSKFISEQKVSLFTINTQLNELSAVSLSELQPVFSVFGIEVVNFNVERVDIPPEEIKKFQSILGRRLEIDQISQAKMGEAYTTMRTFDALEKAAENPSGGVGGIMAAGVGLGLGMGAGVPLGQQLGGKLNIQPPEKESVKESVNPLFIIHRSKDPRFSSFSAFTIFFSGARRFFRVALPPTRRERVSRLQLAARIWSIRVS